MNIVKQTLTIATLCFLFVVPGFVFAAQELWTQQTVGFDPNLTSGAATYSYPIAIPPGRNGIEPILSLEYASTNRDNGSDVGYGWRLPSTRITRRPVTGVNSMYEDGGFQLELNGGFIELEQITATSGEYGTYGAKVEGDFLKITFNSADNSWVVETKYGRRYTFASLSGSNMIDLSDSSRVYAWYLTELSDLSGNNATYTYMKDGERVYPATINYTGHEAEEGQFTVRFEPFATGTPTVRSDVTTSSRSGFPVTTRYRLERIEVDVNGEVNPVLTYVMNYETGSNSVRSRLASMTKYGRSSDGTVISLPETEFSYTESDNNWTLDHSYDVPDWGTTSVNITFGDFSGDGLVDELFIRDSVSGWDKGIYTATPDSMVDRTSDWTLPDFVIDDSHTVVADVNGDGKTDFVRSLYQSGVQVWNQAVFLNAGDGTFVNDTANWSVPQVDFGSPNVKIFDVNGDGLVDFLLQEACGENCWTTQVWENNGVTGWEDVSANYTVPDVRGSVFAPVDVNGDGLVDFWMHQANLDTFMKEIHINNGDGTWTDVTSQWTIPDDYRSAILDINGDGLPDMYRVGFQGQNYAAYLNTGSGWVVDASSTASAGGYGGGRRFFDVNGDGLTDGVYVQCDSGACTQDIRIHDGVLPDLLQQVVTTEGGTVSYAYTSSAVLEDASGNLVNTDLPFVLPTVTSVTKDDGLGNTWVTEYLYKDGKFVRTNPFNGRFAGFGSVVESFTDGSSKVTYFHQGNPEDGTEKGEYVDHFDKIGKTYKVELYNTNGVLLERRMTGWNWENLFNGRSFVFPFRETVMRMNADGSHKDTAMGFQFDDYGSIEIEANYGEVTAGDWGGYTDIGNDKTITSHYYVTSTAGAYIAGLPFFEKTLNSAGAIIARLVYFYDNQTWGNATSGLVTAVRRYENDTVYHTTTNWYDTYGNVTRVRNPNQHSTYYTYNSTHMYPVKVEDHELRATFVETNLVTGINTRTEDPNGTVSEKEIDSFGRTEEERVSSHTNANVLETLKSYTYGTLPMSRVTTTHLDSGITQSAEYMDGFGRLVQTRAENDAGGYSVTDTAYDDAGNVTRVSLPYGDTLIGYEPAEIGQPATMSVFDRLGRILSSTDGAGAVTYGYANWEETVTDEEGKVKMYVYDARKNLVRVKELDGANVYETRYGYDDRFNLLRVEDAVGNVRDFVHDWLGRKISMTDLYAPGSPVRTWVYTYDGAGNMLSAVDPTGTTVNYTYDTLERVLTEDANNAAGTDISYTYDNALNGIGKLALVVRGDVATAYTYNGRGSVAAETKTIGTNEFTTSYAYDRQGREVLRTYPDGSLLTTTHNNTGLVESITLGSTPIVSSVTYTPQGMPGTITFGNGTVTTNVYNLTERGRIATRFTTRGTNTLQDLRYTYDGTGNVVEIIDASGSETNKTSTYVYDNLHRLTGFSTSGLIGGDVSRIYAYDALGNITAHPVHGALTYGGNTNANPHALDSVGGNTWVYDAKGNVTGDGVQTFAWSYRNELDESSDGSTAFVYAYDHTGDRVLKQEGTNGPTFYVGDYIYDAQEEAKEIHLSLGATPVFTRKITALNTDDTWIHADHLNSVAVETDGSGQEISRTDYWPFGGTRYESGTDQSRYDFTNKERDESGLNYFEARYLDTDTARFRSQDTWEGVQKDPQSFNKYAYARNNPVKYVDPDGNSYLAAAQIGAMIGFSFGAVDSIDNSLSMMNYIYQGNIGGVSRESEQIFNNTFSGTIAGAAAGAAAAISTELGGGVLVGGGVAGFTNYSTNWTVSNALEGIGVGEGEAFSKSNLISSTVAGSVASGVVSGFNSIGSVPGWNSGRNSFSAISKTLNTLNRNGNTAGIYYSSIFNQTKKVIFDSMNEGAEEVLSRGVSGNVKEEK